MISNSAYLPLFIIALTIEAAFSLSAANCLYSFSLTCSRGDICHTLYNQQ